MRVLLDTDAFCKLASADLLELSLEILGCQLSDCARLPALPYMLRRGRLHEQYGDEASAALVLAAEKVPIMSPPGDEWLDRLAQVEAIDPGEAQIFAKAAEGGQMVITGDKRALRALAGVSGVSEALSGKVIVLEAILSSLCESLGVEHVRQAIRPVVASDTMIRVCFSASNLSPPEALASYFNDLAAEILPLVLWSPDRGGAA